jgi:hypothetical protein
VQVIYLSNRPDVLAVTVEALRHAVSEALDVLVITPTATGLSGVSSAGSPI